MPYKEFEPRDTLEEALSKLWGAAQEFIPTTRLEEIICMIANAQPTGIHAVPDIGESDVGKVLTAGEDGAVWASGGGGGNPVVFIGFDAETSTMTATWQEIKDNADANKLMYMWVEGDLMLITDVGMSPPNTYIVHTKCLSEDEGVAGWTTNSPNGYPED